MHMDRQTFQIYTAEMHDRLETIERRAVALHKSVNQTYGVGLDYGYHLEMTAAYVRKYGHLVATQAADVILLYAAAYFHDAIEDARLTYHDLCDTLLVVGIGQSDTVQVADIVYAVTNLRGKTRAERAGKEYYRLIRQTRFAPFVKMCDRLANVAYSTRFGLHDAMAATYRDEMPHFIKALTLDDATAVPREMIDELFEMVNLAPAR